MMNSIASDELRTVFFDRLIKALEQYRAKNKFTRVQMAYQLDISPNALSLWLHARTVPTLDNLHILCRKTGISADYLLGIIGEDEEALRRKMKHAEQKRRELMDAQSKNKP